MGDYFAYFKEALPLGHPKLDAMVEYARSVGAELRHELTGGSFRWPFRDMACRVRLEPLSIAECDEFRRRFAPEKDGRIDIL
jgi:hypothetical protein